MCGITGIYAFNEIGRFFSINLHKSNESIEHRGPDAGRVFTHNRVGLGHRRLSILDLSEVANQPMTDPTGRYTIIFNGEIFNYQEIRQRLQNKGVDFQTTGDTEVLLHSYIHEGEKCLQALNGFFSFAIYDQEEESIFIARDRMGIKPLVYYLDEDKLIFASELRALLAYNIDKELDYESMFQYFQLSYIPAPNTILKNTYKLEPGHYLKAKGREVEVKSYFEVKAEEQYQNLSYQGAQDKLLEILRDSVKLRMVSDVPLGAFLSGGIDSSVIVALAAEQTEHLNTFSIGFKDEPLFDETHYAELVASKYNTNHTAFQLTTDDYYDHLFDLMKFLSEPFADSSAIPTYILSKRTRERVTVSLSGDGADELFAGYNKYLGAMTARGKGWKAQLVSAGLPVWKALPKTRNTFYGNKVRQLHRFAECMQLSPKEQYWYLSSWRSEIQTKELLSPLSSKIDQGEYQRRKGILTSSIQGKGLTEILMSDIKMLLPNDMLQKVDSMSMGNSLEVRTPFLDHRLVNFAFSLPDEYKIGNGMKKRVLQDAARTLLPDELYNRPKKGFDVPLARGYKTVLRNWIEKDLLDPDFIASQGIFNQDVIKDLKHQVFNTNNFDQNQVWAILSFQQWWKNYMG